MSSGNSGPKSAYEQGVATRRLWALASAGLLVVIGLALLAFAWFRFQSAERGIGLVGPACSILAGGIVSVVATFGIESWAEQRQRDREAKEYEHREQIYEAISQFMIARFTNSGYDMNTDAKFRITAALWASPETLNRLAAWQQGLTEIMDASIKRALDTGVTHSGSSHSLTDPEKMKAMRLLGRAISAMREDLASTQSAEVSVPDLLRSIFNEEIPDDIETGPGEGE